MTTEAQTARDIAELKAKYATPSEGFTDLGLKRDSFWPASWRYLAEVRRKVIEAEQRPIARRKGRQP